MTYRGLLNSVVALAGVGAPPPPAMRSAIRTQRAGKWPAVILTSTAIVVAGSIGYAAQAENADISIRRAFERTSFSNDEIQDGFFKTAFHAELQFDRRVERIHGADEPVRVFVVNPRAPDRRAEIAAIVADIRAHVDHLDLAMTDDRQTANFVVTLVQRRDLASTIRSHYGRDKAKQIEQSLAPECLSGIGKDRSYRIRRAEAILPVDAGEFAFYDCAYEELLQSLGVINDDSSVPWTMFNDDVQMDFFDVYDQYLVNILYDPRVRPGMTKDEVDALLPEFCRRCGPGWLNANSPKGAASGDSSSDGFGAPCNCPAPIDGKLGNPE